MRLKVSISVLYGVLLSATMFSAAASDAQFRAIERILLP